MRRTLTTALLSLLLPMPPDLGTHALNGSTARASFGSCPDDILADCIGWAAVAEDPGTLTIHRVDPTTGLIEGDFAFTAGHLRIYAPSVFILQ